MSEQQQKQQQGNPGGRRPHILEVKANPSQDSKIAAFVTFEYERDMMDGALVITRSYKKTVQGKDDWREADAFTIAAANGAPLRIRVHSAMLKYGNNGEKFLDCPGHALPQDIRRMVAAEADRQLSRIANSSHNSTGEPDFDTQLPPTSQARRTN